MRENRFFAFRVFYMRKIFLYAYIFICEMFNAPFGRNVECFHIQRLTYNQRTARRGSVSGNHIFLFI